MAHIRQDKARKGSFKKTKKNHPRDFYSHSERFCIINAGEKIDISCNSIMILQVILTSYFKSDLSDAQSHRSDVFFITGSSKRVKKNEAVVPPNKGEKM